MQTLKNILGTYKNVRIHRPKQMAEVMADELVTKDEVAVKITKEDGCLVDDAGPIKMIPRGIRIIWIKCPLVANKLADNGRLRIGWSNAKVNVLPNRRLQCFKCLKIGYIKKNVEAIFAELRKKGPQSAAATKVSAFFMRRQVGRLVLR